MEERNERPLTFGEKAVGIALGGYPAVFGMDWCGDHRLDEGKL